MKSPFKTTKKLNLRFVGFGLLMLLVLSSLNLVFNILRYAAISAQLIIPIAIFLLLLNVLAILLLLHGTVHKTTRNLELGFISVLLLITLVGNYYMFRINSSVNNAIVDTTKDSVEEVETAFVTYNNTQITELNDLAGKKFGIIGSDSFQEGNVLPIQKLSDEKISVQFVEFKNYNDLLLSLFSGSVDVASLPSTYYSMFVNNEGYQEHLDKTKVIYSFKSKITIEATDPNQETKDLTQEPFSILIIGNADGLSDTLIVATFNPKTLTATMTSIARDSYVPIACYEGQFKDKITHARGVSRDCTIQTVENLMDLNIDYFVEVNFQAVVDIVDAIGGLYLYSPVEFVGQDASSTRGNFTVWVGEGWQWMDGLQTLAFARERHHMPNGDLDRQLHQQQVISAIIDRLMTTKDINKLVDVIDAAGTNVKTNIPLDKMTTLANFLIQQLNDNTIKNNSILQILTSRVTGYFSWAYNEAMQLPLIIYKPYLGSIADNQAFIKNNMWTNYTYKNQYSFGFDVNYPYFGPEYYKLVYDEPEIHDKLPDFMPSMSSSSSPWTLTEVETWAQSRTWINLVIDEIWPDEAGYSKDYAYNQVVSQSAKYGVKTATLSTLTVGVIKHELDCSLVENQTDAQCKNVVPNFTGLKLADVQAWSTSHNFPVSIEKILETDARYDKTKVGFVFSQKEAAYTKLSKLTVTALTVYTMDYPTVSLPVTTILSSAWTKTQMDTWFTTNMYVTPTYSYSTINSTIPKDTVIGVTINALAVTVDTVVRTDSKTIAFVLSPGPAVNHPPVVSNSTVSISLTTGLVSGVYSGSVTATDADTTDVLTYALVGTNSTPATGTLVFNSNGSYTYTPAVGAVAGATDTFSYKVNDTKVDSATATVTITLAP